MTGSTNGQAAFFGGQGIEVPLGKIESTLLHLWGADAPAATEDPGEESGGPAPTRVVLSNLVIVACSGDAEKVAAVLPTVEARYPCRAILVVCGDEVGRKVTAEVSAFCSVPEPGRPQACSERIVLHIGADALDLLPGAIRPLLESDLPFVLWWIDDPRRSRAVFLDLADEATRIIIDQPDPGGDIDAVAFGLDPAPNPYSRDMAWFGITRWRELIAQFFDPAGAAANLDHVTEVEVCVASSSTTRPPRVAAYLAGWLAGQLDWRVDRRDDLGSGSLRATLRRPKDGGPVSVTVRCTPDPDCSIARITAIRLRADGPDGASTYSVVRSGHQGTEVRIESTGPGRASQPRTMTVRKSDPTRRISAALESGRDDPPFRRAWPIARWLIDGTPPA